MNNIFKKEQVINLDNKYYIESDGQKGVSLVFHEIREKTNKKGEKEDYNFTDRYYFLTISQALEQYIKMSQNTDVTLEEAIVDGKRILNVLEDFRVKYKNWD